MQGLAASSEHASDLGILAGQMTEADAARRGGTKRHQAREAHALFRDLADHDALEVRRLRVPEKVNRMFAIRVFLAGGVVNDLLSASKRADDAKAVNSAGKVRYSYVVLRMHPSPRCVDDRKTLSFAIALLDQVDGLLHVDDVFDLLRSKQ